MTLVQPPAEPPYDYDTAEAQRREGEQIYGCWFCLNVSPKVKGRPYWPLRLVKFIGHRVACPKHYEEHG